jgi:cell division control protein 6
MIEHDRYLILTLDEVDYYIKTTGEDIVYELTRMTDAIRNVSQRINFIFIARDRFFMNKMSKETLSTFRPQERLEFRPYSINQIHDILKDRVDEAFEVGTVSDEMLSFIAEYTVKFGGGDARYAILILLSSGLIADREMSSRVMPEYIREAQENSDPQIRDEDIILLSKDEKYVLLAIARCLNNNANAIYIPLMDVESTYQSICEEYSVQAVGSVLLQRLIKDLNASGIISLNDNFELGLSGIKSKILEIFLKKMLNGRISY